MDNKTVRCLSAQRLRERAIKISPDYDYYKLAFKNRHKIGLDNFIIQDIKDCLASDFYIDIGDRFSFLESLLIKYSLKDFGQNFVNYLIKRIPELMGTNRKSTTRVYAIKFFILLKNNYSNFREKMMEFIYSNNLLEKEIAPYNYETFCEKNEIKPLIHFQNDNRVTELSMCGPLEYELRNLALEKISKIIGNNFMLYKIKEN